MAGLEPAQGCEHPRPKSLETLMTQMSPRSTIPQASRRDSLVQMLLSLSLCVSSATAVAAPVVLKEMPAQGVLRVGEVAYVDDGKCPSGQVKKVIGGSQKAGVARQVECVKRPEGS